LAQNFSFKKKRLFITIFYTLNAFSQSPSSKRLNAYLLNLTFKNNGLTSITSIHFYYICTNDTLPPFFLLAQWKDKLERFFILNLHYRCLFLFLLSIITTQCTTNKKYHTPKNLFIYNTRSNYRYRNICKIEMKYDSEKLRSNNTTAAVTK